MQTARKDDPLTPNFVHHRLSFILESAEYGQGYRISLYTDLEKMKSLADSIYQNNFCEFEDDAYISTIKDFEYLKDRIEKYKVNLKSLLKLIYLIQADENEKNFIFSKDKPWGSSTIIPEGLGRLDIGVGLTGGKSYAFQLQSRWMDLPKELTHWDVITLLRDTYEAVKKEISIE